MSLIVGLDVSTSVVGVCVLNTEISDDQIYLLDRIEFKHCNTLWEKADVVAEYLSALRDKSLQFNKAAKYREELDFYGEEVRIIIEEPLMGFRSGMSSAQTITQLMRFNGIVSYISREVFRREPEYISSSHARKLCGMKLVKTSIGGPQKEQVFSYMSEHDLKSVVWPVKKSGKIVDWSRDSCDAYVIANAAAVEGVVDPTTKKKKKKKSMNDSSLIFLSSDDYFKLCH